MQQASVSNTTASRVDPPWPAVIANSMKQVLARGAVAGVAPNKQTQVGFASQSWHFACLTSVDDKSLRVDRGALPLEQGSICPSDQEIVCCRARCGVTHLSAHKAPCAQRSARGLPGCPPCQVWPRSPCGQLSCRPPERPGRLPVAPAAGHTAGDSP